MKQSEDVLRQIYDSVLKFSVPMSPNQVYATIVQEAIKLVKAHYGSVVLVERGEFKRVYGSLPIAYNLKTRKKGSTYKAYKEKKAIQVHISELAKAHPKLAEIGIKWTIHIPLSYQNRSIGVLAINTKNHRRFNEKELGILELFGSMASLAIRKTQLYDETKKALAVRDLFISMAAHELRTPLTSVSGYIQLLNSKITNTDTTEGRWVQQLSYESTRLANLVNELLEINRIRSGKLQYIWKDNNIKEIINRAVASFKFIRPNREVIFEDNWLGDCFTVSDFDKLVQVLTNILENAAKFSENSTLIKIILSRKSDYLVISVIDQGQGVDSSELSKIFDEFYKGKDNLKQGMGLGLYISRDIIKKHKGKIKAISTKNKGTTIEITLPLHSI